MMKKMNTINKKALHLVVRSVALMERQFFTNLREWCKNNCVEIKWSMRKLLTRKALHFVVRSVALMERQFFTNT